MFSGKTDDRGLWAGIQAGVLFFLAALACIYLSRQPATIAAIWLPNAILTAALLRAPLRQWPAILLCSAVANLAANRLYGDSLWMSAAFLPANLSEAIFAAMLLRINRVREDFEFNLHSAVRVLWAGALIPPLLGASVGAVLVSVFGMGRFPEMWARWYVGDAMGMLALLPLCMASNLAAWRHGLSGRAGVDNAMLLLVTLVISFVALTRLPYAFIYVLLPLLVAAASTSVFGTALIGCLNTCFIAVLIALGVFLPESSQQRFGEPLLYLPMALTLIPAFLVSVIMERSRREQHQVAIGEAQFRGAMEFSAIGMALVSLEGRLFKVNEALCRMLGYSAERLGELSFQEITYVDDLELDLDLVRDLLAGRINSYQMEKRYLRQDGETFWARISVSLVRDEEESPSTSSPRWRISTVASVPSWSASASPNGSSWPPTPGRSASGSGTWRATACTGISACSTCTASAAVPGIPRWSSGRRACMPRITTACCASWSAPSAGCRNSTASSVSSAPTARFATCGRSPR